MPSKLEPRHYVDADNGQTLDFSGTDAISIVVARNVPGSFSALPGQEQLFIGAIASLAQAEVLLQKYVDLAYRVAGKQDRKAAELLNVFRRSGRGFDVLKMWQIDPDLLQHKELIRAAIQSSIEKVCLQPQLFTPAIQSEPRGQPPRVQASLDAARGVETIAFKKDATFEAESSKTAADLIHMFKGRPITGMHVEVGGMSPLTLAGPTARPPEPTKETGRVEKIGVVVGIDKPGRVAKIRLPGPNLMHVSFGYEEEGDGRTLARLCYEETLAVFKLDFEKFEDRQPDYLLTGIDLDSETMLTPIELAAANESQMCESTTKAA